MQRRPVAPTSAFHLLCCCLLLAMICSVGGASAPLAFGAGPEAEQPSAEGPAVKASDAAGADCRQLADLLQQQKGLISREIGQVKREIAALRDDVSRPGIKEIFAGIGYIFGLTGIGLYVHCRRSRAQS